LLFVKDALAWPRSSGHDVHSYYMMLALTELGHEVSLITAAEPAPEAIAGLPLALRRIFADGAGANGHPLLLNRLQERFRSYWGVSPERIKAVARAAEDCDADVVVVVGLGVLPYLGAVAGRLRVWYAADEWAWHHLSQVRLTQPKTWSEMRPALVKGLYERAYGPILDRVWVVTEADRRAMHWVAGVSAVDVIPNGVDGDYYAPRPRPEGERTCTFWGRLDFGPNIQALEWFCGQVWPLVRRQAPDARFTVYGFQPSDAVRALTGRDGIELIPNLPDLRDEIARHQVVVLPFVSGGGIKNKLLEAASMGRALVCSATACSGLRLGGRAPFLRARDPGQWRDALLSLWARPELRRSLGADARRWVLEHHSWAAAARNAVRGLEGISRKSGRRILATS
jgi:glycosyltransferase involved in cell wall biosynthesis